MRKPVVGVIPLVDSKKESLWMLPGYLEGIISEGGVPFMLPLSSEESVIEKAFEICDGFLFTGGQDVNPSLYGETKKKSCGEICDKRDEMEKIIFRRCLLEDRPLLGICRGIQFINAMLGGTLYQDLPTEHPSELEHHQKPPYDIPVHEVKLLADTPLQLLLETETLAVNSYHHQAIKELGEGLLSMAVTPDSLVEAVYMPDKRFVWGIQWHPEFSCQTDQNSRKIFRKFIETMMA